MDFLVIFWLYGFLENVFLNKFFSFMDFSLIWTILAGTNVVHISGIGVCRFISKPNMSLLGI